MRLMKDHRRDERLTTPVHVSKERLTESRIKTEGSEGCKNRHCKMKLCEIEWPILHRLARPICDGSAEASGWASKASAELLEGASVGASRETTGCCSAENFIPFL
jgi:hypothetical protein